MFTTTVKYLIRDDTERQHAVFVMLLLMFLGNKITSKLRFSLKPVQISIPPSAGYV